MSELIENCIASCQQCVKICNECTSACLGEKDLTHLAYCIQLNIECSAFCEVTVQLLTLNSKRTKEICHVCVEICMACAAECGTHHHMEHCVRCSEACAACAEQCRLVASAA
jgi:hypothetical protein